MSKIKYAWLFLALSVLIVNIFSYASDPNGDATGNIMFFLGIIGLPLSIVPTLLTLSLVGYVVPDSSNSYTFASICFAYIVAGLIQWFWLIPAIAKRFTGAGDNKPMHLNGK